MIKKAELIRIAYREFGSLPENILKRLIKRNMMLTKDAFDREIISRLPFNVEIVRKNLYMISY